MLQPNDNDTCDPARAVTCNNEPLPLFITDIGKFRTQQLRYIVHYRRSHRVASRMHTQDSIVAQLNRTLMSKLTERMVRIRLIEVPRFSGLDQTTLRDLRSDDPAWAAAPQPI